MQFSPGGAGKEVLAGLFKADIPVFRWFARLYLEGLDLNEPPADDELAAAREVFARLYRHAGRPLPDYFPAAPIETLYDPGRKAWRDLLYRLKKASVKWDGDRASIAFTDDMQHFEIREYVHSLPPVVKHKRHGKALVIETPREFRAWLDGAAPAPGGWRSRLLGR